MTQGTGRGTCWWINNIILYINFFLIIVFIIFYFVGIYNFLNNFNYYIQLKLFFVEELVIIFLFYNFIKLIIFGSIVELIWPTQFFNRKHSSSYQLIRFRTFTETLVKLRPINYNYNVFNKSLIKHFFVKNILKKK